MIRYRPGQNLSPARVFNKTMRHTAALFAALFVAVSALVSCNSGKSGFTYTFDGDKEMSGVKFALKDINPELPRDWDDYNFVVLEYKISTSQRFQLGFTTDDGYNELRIMSYVPGAWNKLAIPLHYYVDLPDAAFDLAATSNHPRYTGWVNLGGKRGPMHGVDSIGVRMRRAIGNPSIEIRNVTLSVEDPGDEYLEDTPAIDRFGQQTRLNYEGKVASEEELRAQWAAEESEAADTDAYNYSTYGGYKQKKLAGTGFFRLAQEDGKWWFVDPEGYVFLSVGADCVAAGGGGRIRDVEHRDGMYEALPPEDIKEFGRWNLQRRYGDDYMAKANEMTVNRMDRWGVNTIANWSSMDIIRMNRKAFLISLGNLGMDGKLMGLCDVYAPEYKARLVESIKNFTARFKDNKWLVGYFVGNEPSWINEEPLLCQRILDGPQRPIKDELTKYLAANGDTDATRQAFILKTFRTFLLDVQNTLKKYDPNHLNLGIRFGEPQTLCDELIKLCGEAFDVFSFNSYSLAPGKEMLDRTYEISGIPMIIGEYHFGTVDRGLAQALWQVESQEQRGVAYRYYTENAFSHPALIGTAYFQWSDQDITGRMDGENYNCGIVDVTDRPYKYQTEAMMETAKVLYDVHSGTRAPYSEKPHNARGHELVPDLWNE